MDRVIQKKQKNKVEYIILALMLLFSLLYLLMPIHIQMAYKSCRQLLGLFFTRNILFEVSLVDRDYVLKSEQIVPKNFRAMGLSRDHLLSEISTERPIILVVEDDDLDKLTDKKLVVVKDIYKRSSYFPAQYLYPLSLKGKRANIVLYKVRKPEQTALYAFLRKSYFLEVVKEGNVTALYDRCQSEVRKIFLSKGHDWSSFPEKE